MTYPNSSEKLKALLAAKLAARNASVVSPIQTVTEVIPETIIAPIPEPEKKKLTPAEFLAALRAKASMPHRTPEEVKEALKPELVSIPETPVPVSAQISTPLSPINTAISNALTGTDRYGNLITYNEEQSAFITLAAKQKSCILLGPAGTGKTTCVQGGIAALMSSNPINPIHADGHKHLTDGNPGIICTAYTRRATANIARVMTDDLKGNCITIHKLLEYQPVYYEVEDPSTGLTRNTMNFEPTRNRDNPLPRSISTIVIEESSMVSVELFNEILDAIAPDHEVQFIFVGDIQQLPPVFGAAILGFKMLELPTIELTQVYRQALESPIIRLAHRILSGNPIPGPEYKDWNDPGKLTIHPWKKKISPENAVATIGAFLKKAEDGGLYNTDDDIVLCPFNKSFGTIELNKLIANHLARKHSRVTYEIIAGFNKHYFSVGDRVLYEKEDARIISISINAAYTAVSPQRESTTLDYWGHDSAGHVATAQERTEEELQEDLRKAELFLETMSVGSSEDRVQQSSHIITVELSASGATFALDKASEINNLSLGFALTVHKSQGSEWRKVFLCLHQSHATMLQRELLYTAVTRAKEELYVICEPESFTKGILSQRIKGNTLAEKAEYFRGKLEIIKD